MRANLIVLLPSFYILFYLNALAQNAQFETSFYFEDAAGNRDTIVIGADTSADELVNTHLGEVLLTGPWDSTFEVRVAREDNYHDYLWFGQPLYLYNKRITFLFDVPECGYSTSVIFLICTNHYPVIVTWDTTVWSFNNSPCPIDGSFFHHTDEVLEPGWWPAYHYACLGPRSSFKFDTTDNEMYSGIIDSVLGVGTEFIYGLQLNTTQLENPISPCYLEVGVEDQTKGSEFGFEVFPNPTVGIINVKLSQDIIKFSNSFNIAIFNYQGVEVYNKRLDSAPVIVDNLPIGIYFVVLVDEYSRLISMRKIAIL